jgi:hypothetical protein
MKPVTTTLLTILVGVCFAAGFSDLGVNNSAAFAGVESDADEQNSTATAAEFSPFVDQEGNISLPKGYKQKWSHLGGWAVAKKDGEAIHELHDVYTNPDAYNQYEKTGEFPDGTVLVKELVSVGEKEASSGNGYFMGDFIGLEVSVKDETRFEDEPGNWAYFSFGHKYPLEAKCKNTTSSELQRMPRRRCG